MGTFDEFAIFLPQQQMIFIAYQLHTHTDIRSISDDPMNLGLLQKTCFFSTFLSDRSDALLLESYDVFYFVTYRIFLGGIQKQR